MLIFITEGEDFQERLNIKKILSSNSKIKIITTYVEIMNKLVNMCTYTYLVKI